MKAGYIRLIVVGAVMHFVYFLIFILQFFDLLGFIPFSLENLSEIITAIGFVGIAVYFWVKFCKSEATFKNVLLYTVSVDLIAIVLMFIFVLIGNAGFMPELLIPLFQFNFIMFLILYACFLEKDKQARLYVLF